MFKIPRPCKCGSIQQRRCLPSQARGYVSGEEIRQKLGWAESRISSTLNSLMEEGLALVDEQDPGG